MVQTRSVDLWLTELRCLACHSRDSRQSPWSEIIAEEGSGKAAESIPQLTWVGEKLQGPWVEKLLQGKIKQKPRPWVKARMPAFPETLTTASRTLASNSFLDGQRQASYPIDLVGRFPV